MWYSPTAIAWLSPGYRLHARTRSQARPWSGRPRSLPRRPQPHPSAPGRPQAAHRSPTKQRHTYQGGGQRRRSGPENLENPCPALRLARCAPEHADTPFLGGRRKKGAQDARPCALPWYRGHQDVCLSGRWSYFRDFWTNFRAPPAGELRATTLPDSPEEPPRARGSWPAAAPGFHPSARRGTPSSATTVRPGTEDNPARPEAYLCTLAWTSPAGSSRTDWVMALPRTLRW